MGLIRDNVSPTYRSTTTPTVHERSSRSSALIGAAGRLLLFDASRQQPSAPP
jgi:hypothetical protein